MDFATVGGGGGQETWCLAIRQTAVAGISVKEPMFRTSAYLASAGPIEEARTIKWRLD